MDYQDDKMKRSEDELKRQVRKLKKEVRALKRELGERTDPAGEQTISDYMPKTKEDDKSMTGPVNDKPETRMTRPVNVADEMKASASVNSEDVLKTSETEETADETGVAAENTVNETPTAESESEQLSENIEEKVDDRVPVSVRNDYDDDDDDDRTDADDREKVSAGEIVFRVIAGFLVFAICITAVIAVLLATGHLNRIIDDLSGDEMESTVVESSVDITPTVRVTLTPTPLPEETETPSPTPTAALTPADTSDATSKDKTTEATMNFYEVNDVVTAKETTNLRNVPSQGEESFIVYILQNGETLNRTGMSDEGWSRLDYNGQVVYAMSNLLTTDLTKKEESKSTESDVSGDTEIQIQTVFTDVNEQVTPKIEVNLRKLPSVTNPKATVVATVKNGEVFTRTGVNEELGWSRVEYKGETLYCITSYVETVAPTA